MKNGMWRCLCAPISLYLKENRGGIAPSPNENTLLIYGVCMGNGVAFTYADGFALLNAWTLK